MFRKVLALVVLMLALCLRFAAQPAERRLTREEYIQKHKEDAIREMLASGIPASITLSQALLESDNGNSPLAVYAKNHFGIKCSNWEGAGFYKDDDTKNECFRKYYTVYESYQDHSSFLKNRQRYAFLFELNHLDYKGWALGLKKAGYATNPRYPELLIKIIEDNKLYEFDTVKMMPSLSDAKKEKEKPVVASRSFPIAALPVSLHENNIKYVIARKGDSYFKIASELNLRLWQIYKYNDLQKGGIPEAGDIIYIQPKRNSAKEDTYLVKEGDTMHGISQLYGIKLAKLYQKNNMAPGSEPQAGQKLSLRRRLKGREVKED